MHFIFLTQYYLPETGAPQNRLSDLAQRLVEMGHSVQVLTAMPNYPVGKIFDGYRKKLLQREQLNGVETVRCWIYPSNSRKTLPRLISYISFVLSSAALGTLTLRKGDILLVESPPIFLGLSAWWLARIKRARMVFNVSDLYPETAISLGYLKNPLLQKVFYNFEAWCYRVSSLVTGQTKGIVDSIHQRFPEIPVYLLTNGVDLAKFENFVKGENKNKRDRTPEPFVVGYAGVLGQAQKLETILEAAYLLRDSQAIRFYFYGDGPMRRMLEEKAEELSLTNVEFLGRRTHEEVLKDMRFWNAGIVPLIDSPLMSGALPSKMFEIMAAAIPVILSTPKGEASSLVEAAKAGVWAPAENSRELAKVILKLAVDEPICQELGKNGHLYIKQYYDRAQIARNLVSHLKEMKIGS